MLYLDGFLVALALEPFFFNDTLRVDCIDFFLATQKQNLI
jgi:hypothetical protein